MDITEIKPLWCYGNVRKGDLFYAHVEQRSWKMCEVTSVRANEFTYLASHDLSGSVWGEHLKDAVLFRVGALGKVEVLAGENILNVFRQISQNKTPAR